MNESYPIARSEHWAIIGGGFLGMTLGLRASQAGFKVTLVEAEPELGGLAGAWSLGEIVWDRHYHVTLLSDSYNRQILRELEIEDEVEWVETRTGIYSGARLYPMSNALEYLKLPVLGLIDKLRLAATIVYASRIRDWERLEDITVEAWLTRLSGRKTFEHLWLPLLRAKLGENYRQASAAFIWATIARLYAARRTALKKEMFGYVRGGYARTIERFAQTLRANGVQVRLSTPIERISVFKGKISLDQAGTSEGEPSYSEAFDKAVMTVPCNKAARICQGLSANEIEALENVKYMGVVCASVLMRNPLADYYLTYITDSGIPFTAVIEMSAMVDRKHFDGSSLVYLPKYVSPEDPLFEKTDIEIEESFLSALERMYTHFRRSDVMAFRVSRDREVFSIPRLGYSKSLPSMKTSIPGLYIVNSAHIINGTLNVNETIQIAESVASELFGQTK